MMVSGLDKITGCVGNLRSAQTLELKKNKNSLNMAISCPSQHLLILAYFASKTALRSQSRPESMNVIPFHSRAKVSVALRPILRHWRHGYLNDGAWDLEAGLEKARRTLARCRDVGMKPI